MIYSVRKNKGRKGFMHTVEAIFAFMILISYSGALLSSGVSSNDWSSSRLYQESRDILSLMSYMGHTELLESQDYESFDSVASYVAGLENIGVAISTENLVPPFIDIAIITQNSQRYDKYRSNLSLFFMGHNKPLYVDGRQVNITIRQKSWYDHDLDEFDVLLVPIEGGVPEMNDLIDNMDTNSSKIKRLRDSGVAIIQVSNLDQSSFVENYDIQRDIFGLSHNRTLIKPSDTNVTSMVYTLPTDPGFMIQRYYHTVPFKIDTSFVSNVEYKEWNDTYQNVEIYVGNTTYYMGLGTFNETGWTYGDAPPDVNFSDVIVSSNMIYHSGNVSLKGEEYPIVVINTSSDMVYDKIYIDLNQNHNFTDDVSSSFSEGDTMGLDGNDYIISKIDPRGNYIEFNMQEPHKFDVMNTDNHVYHKDGFTYTKNGTNSSSNVPLAVEFNATYGSRFPVAIVNPIDPLGRTAWITDSIKSDDEWHIIRSLILWSVKKQHTISEVNEKTTNFVAYDKVKISSHETRTPYIIKWKAWKYD